MKFDGISIIRDAGNTPHFARIDLDLHGKLWGL